MPRQPRTLPPETLDFLKANYLSMRQDQLSRQTGLSVSLIRRIAQVNGFVRARCNDAWKDEEIALLKACLNSDLDQEIADKLNALSTSARVFSASLVNHQIKKLKLHRDAKVKAKHRSLGMRKASRSLAVERVAKVGKWLRLDGRTAILIRPGMDVQNLKSKFGLNGHR